MAIQLKCTYKGSTKSAEISSLPFRGYWADEKGIEIKEVRFDSVVRLYISSFWAYNAKLKIVIRPVESVVSARITEEILTEGNIDELIPAYFTQEKRYLEVRIEKRSNYKSLSEDISEFELCCDVMDEYGCFYEKKNIVQIQVSNPAIIFPLLARPLNDEGNNMPDYRKRYWNGKAKTNSATFGSRRSNNRLHAGRDLYGLAHKTEIVSICDGIVLGCHFFYSGTYEITILHTTNDGRKFIVRYGEVDSQSIKVRKNDNVKQGQVIAKIGNLTPSVMIDGKKTNMLHFELYTGDEGYNLQKALTDRNGDSPYKRRNDLHDPITLLEEGYNNVFAK
jgi:murein DD-endopeptidase MepM/ murein hydrolase activator NlpD